MSSYDDKHGFNDQPTFDRPPPPEVLGQVVDHLGKLRHLPDCFRGRRLESAQWFVDLLEPPGPMEKTEWVTNSKDGGGWKSPYADRVISCLRIFLGMGATHQAYVVDGVQSGVPWRGDKIDMYIEIRKQTAVMNEYVAKHGKGPDGQLPEEYTKMAGKHIRDGLNKMVAPK